jgi:DNA-binding MarR family transcriptional regulator
VKVNKTPGSELRRAIAALQRLAELLAQRRAQLAQEAGISEQQWRLLEEIAAPGFLPSLFARQSRVTPAAVSKVLRQLLDKQLVAVAISEHDARQRAYTPTARGRKALARIEAARQDAVRTVWSALAPRELSQFADLSETLAVRLESYAHARSQASAHTRASGRPQAL